MTKRKTNRKNEPKGGAIKTVERKEEAERANKVLIETKAKHAKHNEGKKLVMVQGENKSIIYKYV